MSGYFNTIFLMIVAPLRPHKELMNIVMSAQVDLHCIFIYTYMHYCCNLKCRAMHNLSSTRTKWDFHVYIANAESSIQLSARLKSVDLWDGMIGILTSSNFNMMSLPNHSFNLWQAALQYMDGFFFKCKLMPIFQPRRLKNCSILT